MLKFHDFLIPIEMVLISRGEKINSNLNICIGTFLKTNDSIYDVFNFAVRMINKTNIKILKLFFLNNEVKTILIICPFTVPYVNLNLKPILNCINDY